MDSHASYAEVQEVALAGLSPADEQRHLLAYRRSSSASCAN